MRRAALAIVVALIGAASEARADGLYGRFEGDVAVDATAGVSFSRGTGFAFGARGLYLGTVGLYGSLEVAASSDARFAPGHDLRAFGGGIEARPLFLPRFLKARETGPAIADLVLDSIALRLGARHEPGLPGTAFDLGFGLEVPLLAEWSGPFLAGTATYTVARDGLTGIGNDRGWSAVLALGFRLPFRAHIVDVGDVRPPP